MGDKQRWIEVNEDLMALVMGSFVCIVALLGAVLHEECFGWALAGSVWNEAGRSFATASKSYVHMPVVLAAVLTVGFLLAMFTAAAKMMRYDVRTFVVRFFWISVITLACCFIGNNKIIASRFTNEIWLVLCLLVGIVIVNLRSIRPIGAIASRIVDPKQADLYIKTALVILGLTLGVQAAGAIGTVKDILLRGVIAVVANYLITWTLAFLVARKLFRFEADEAAVLASAISICGVAAAMAIAAAIKIRNKEFPSAVASLVVVFSAFELLALPAIAGMLLYRQPYVAGSFMAMAVKTDGAAVAAGKLTDGIVSQRIFSLQHVVYKPDSVLLVTSAEKMMIDVFIGVFAIILAAVFLRSRNEKADMGHVQTLWVRFPKFIIGATLAFVAALFIGLHSSAGLVSLKAVVPGVTALRVLLFGMTFLSLGLLADINALKGARIGKLAVAYPVILVAVVMPVAFVVSWICFHGAPLPLK